MREVVETIAAAGFASSEYLQGVTFQGVDENEQDLNDSRAGWDRHEELKRPLGDHVPVRLSWHGAPTVPCSLRQVYDRLFEPDLDAPWLSSNPLRAISWNNLHRHWSADELVVNAIAVRQADGPDELTLESIVALSASSIACVFPP